MQEAKNENMREMKHQAGSIDGLEIRPATVLDEALRRFLHEARLSMFSGRIDPHLIPKDVSEFAATYATGAGVMLVARHAEAGIVGTVAYRAYDHRFGQLDYRGRRVVEVVRLFVLPAFRRGGLASRLFQLLRVQAEHDGVEVLYLHTHPFLPGALEFWRASGFRILDEEDEPVWQTIHMGCEMKEPSPT